MTEIGIHELYARDPEAADRVLWGREVNPHTRRGFLRSMGLAAMAGALADEPGPLTIPGNDGLRVMNDRPINAETPPTLLDDYVTPNNRHFVRNNGHVSARALTRSLDGWSLTIDGEVQNPFKLSMADLKNFPRTRRNWSSNATATGARATIRQPRETSRRSARWAARAIAAYGSRVCWLPRVLKGARCILAITPGTCT